MKRYVSIDFLRGIAIILMLALHVFIKTWDTDLLLAAVSGGNIGMALLAILIVYFASFAGLFIMVSAIGNFFSMHRQFLNMKEKLGLDKACSIVLKNQLTRGGIMFLMGYGVNVFLWQYIFRIPVALVINESLADYWTSWESMIYWVDIITFIGMATMLVAVVYIALQKRNKTIPEIRRAMGWISAIVLIISPFILMVTRSIVMEGIAFWPSPHHNVADRTFGTNVIYLILTWFVGKNQSVFPWVAISFIGTIMGLDLVEGPVTKQFKKKWIRIGVFFLIVGLILQILFAGIASALPEDLATIFVYGFGEPIIADGPSSATRMFVDGGEIICTALLLYWVEGHRRAKTFAKYTVFVRRCGMISLTLYALQFMALIPMAAIMSGIFKYPLGDSYKALFWQSAICIVALVAIFILITILWEKVQFKGTLEWMISKILSRGNPNAMDRLNAQDFLYNVDPLGEPPVS